MKDFDAERKEREESTLEDRKFLLGGHVFYAKASVRPEVMFEFEEIGEDTPPSQVLKVVDQLIIDMVEDGDDAHAKYRELRTTGDAVDMTTLLDICQWLIGSVTGRPTDPPVASSPLPETPKDGTDSTGDSSSEDSTEG